MRQRLLSVLGLACALILAGCTTTDTDETPTEPAPEPSAPTQREPIEHSGTMVASADPTNFAGMPICSSPSAQCDRVPFAVNESEAPLDLQATLAWGLPANDLDLYLYKGDEEVSTDGINFVGDPPVNEQVMQVAGLQEGEYTFIIVGWSAAGESYTLSVVFE